MAIGNVTKEVSDEDAEWPYDITLRDNETQEVTGIGQAKDRESFLDLADTLAILAVQLRQS